MLVQIGTRRSPRHGLVDNLLACHARIRYFIDLGAKLATSVGPTPGEIQSIASSVTRYFRESLPLHATDEEESLLPRLHGHDPLLDAALDRMCREHAEHDTVIAELLRATEAMAARPSCWSEQRQRLSSLCRALEESFEVHLAQEEQIVFPAVDTVLSAGQREEIVAEMAARRA